MGEGVFVSEPLGQRLEDVWKLAVHVIASVAKQSRGLVRASEIAMVAMLPRNDTKALFLFQILNSHKK